MRCSTHFRESRCPAGRAKKDNWIQCAGTKCTDNECCKEALKESERDTCDNTQTTCPSAPYYSKKAQPPTCAGLTCEREECCTRNYQCDEKGTEVKGKCTDLKKSFYPENFCNGDTCTGDSCCGTLDCDLEPPCKTTKDTCDDANEQPKPRSLWASCCFEKSTDCMAAVRCKAGELVKPTIEWACTNASISQTATEEAKRAAAKTCYDNGKFDSSKDCISKNAFEAEKANEQNAKAEDFKTKYDTCWKAQQAAGVDVNKARSECYRKTQTENSVKTEDIEANAQKKAMEAATNCTKSVTECQADTKKALEDNGADPDKVEEIMKDTQRKVIQQTKSTCMKQNTDYSGARDKYFTAMRGDRTASSYKATRDAAYKEYRAASMAASKQCDNDAKAKFKQAGGTEADFKKEEKKGEQTAVTNTFKDCIGEKMAQFSQLTGKDRISQIQQSQKECNEQAKIALADSVSNYKILLSPQ